MDDFDLSFGSVVDSLKFKVDFKLLLFHSHWLLYGFLFGFLLLLFGFLCLLLFLLGITLNFLFERKLNFDPVVLLEVTRYRDFDN